MNMKNIIGFIIILFSSTIFAISSDIVALVNDHPITKFDFEDRKNMIVNLNQVDLSDSLTEIKLNNEILNVLIEEELLNQYAENAGTTISKEELDEAISSIEERNKMPKGGIYQMLKEREVNPASFRKQIKGELIKQNILGSLSGGVSVSQNELDMALANSDERDFTVETWVFTSRDDSSKSLDQMKNFKKQFTSCNKVNVKLFDKFADGEKFDRKLSQLPNRTKSVVTDTKANTSSQVYVEDNKFKFVFVCKKDRIISADDLSKVTHFLSNKKMSQKAMKFFKDLKAKAYIQTFSTN
jgi:hypothetical protein